MEADHETGAMHDIDTALGRLPRWEPPADFAARLAAAAARQEFAPPPRSPWIGWRLMDITTQRLPLVAGSALLASILAWGVPWQALMEGAALLWIGPVVMAATGAVMTWRVLRSP